LRQESDRNSIIANGWQQGAILNTEDLPNGMMETLGLDKGLYVVANQSCDVVQSLEVEPSLELVKATPITCDHELYNGGFFNAKSARRLITPSPTSVREHYLHFDVKDKLQIPRGFLFSHQDIRPCCHLADSSGITFKTWLAMRYNRASFPDEFNERNKYPRRKQRGIAELVGLSLRSKLRGIRPAEINRAKNKLVKGLEKQVNGDPVCMFVEGLYFNISPETELDRGKDYELNCFALIPSDVPLEILDKVENCMGVFASDLGKERVVVQSMDALVMTMAEVTVEELRYYKRFSLEQLTLKHGESID